jgi:hypothetical protein
MARASTSRIIWLGLATCLLVAGVLSSLASTAPDGLERVATDLGLASSTPHPPVGSPLTGFATAGNSSRLGTGLAGVIGVAVTAAAAFGLFRALASTGQGKPAPTLSAAGTAGSTTGSS